MRDAGCEMRDAMVIGRASCILHPASFPPNAASTRAMISAGAKKTASAHRGRDRFWGERLRTPHVVRVCLFPNSLVGATAGRFATAGRLTAASRFAAATPRAGLLDPRKQATEQAAATAARVAAARLATAGRLRSAASGLGGAAGRLGSTASRLRSAASRFAARRGTTAAAENAVEQAIGTGIAGAGNDDQAGDQGKDRSRFHEQDPYKGQTGGRVRIRRTAMNRYRRLPAAFLDSPSSFCLKRP